VLSICWSVIDKNIRALSKIAHRHYILEKGRVVWTGDSEQLMRSEDLLHRFWQEIRGVGYDPTRIDWMRLPAPENT
jgi:ABC-type transporter Mla maintaining outer membrane lipid asymmetry ATPase subunit MlaF